MSFSKKKEENNIFASAQGWSILIFLLFTIIGRQRVVFTVDRCGFSVFFCYKATETNKFGKFMGVENEVEKDELVTQSHAARNLLFRIKNRRSVICLI